MKHIFILILSCGLGLHVTATIHSVNNEPGSAADFSSLPAAITAASDGDTIYLYPGTASYGDISINKQLYLLGPGHKVDYTTLVPQVGQVSFVTGSGNSVVKGIAIYMIVCNGFNVVNNVLLSGCLLSAQNPFYLSGTTTMNSWIVEGCVIFNQSNGMSFNGSGVQNWILRNNIVTHWNASGNWISYATNMVVEHNVFIQTNSASATAIGSSNTNVDFHDNIFYYTASIPGGSLSTGCTSCTFSGNITYTPYMTLPDLPGSNFNNQNPQFVNVPLTDPTFTYDKDFRLDDASIGNNAATDGEDVGVYGGIHDFRNKGWSNTMPRVGMVNVLNNTAPPGGQIQVNLKAYSAGN